MTPLHFACLNPNTDILDQLLQINGDFNMLDNEMRRPIHYAAVCESSSNLQYLLDKGANVGDLDMKKSTCLHTAAKAGRSDNIRLILSKNKSLVKLKDKHGHSAMSYACLNSDLESIKALVESGEVKIN